LFFQAELLEKSRVIGSFPGTGTLWFKALQRKSAGALPPCLVWWDQEVGGDLSRVLARFGEVPSGVKLGMEIAEGRKLRNHCNSDDCLPNWTHSIMHDWVHSLYFTARRAQ
jgi:hypothetical protein